MDRPGLRHTVLVEKGSASCSGIIISTHRGYILTHASLLLPHLSEKAGLGQQLLKNGRLSYADCEKIGSIKVTCERRASIVSSNTNSPSAFVGEEIGQQQPDFDLLHYTGHVCEVWFAESFRKIVASLLSASERWTLTEEIANSSKTSDERTRKDDGQGANYALLFLPCFVLISVGDALRQYSIVSQANTRRPAPSVGETAYVVATPFGSLSPVVFLNSVSKGIISNVVGPDSELLLTDARCIPGTEGGALYTVSCHSYPVAMVVAPLCWKAGEWIGLSLACRLKCILNSLKSVLFSARLSYEKLSQVNVESSSKFDNVGVVMVCSNDGSWGSGVIIDWSRGLVLTCSHVVKTDRQVAVHMNTSARRYTADVIVATDNAKVYDLALLQLKQFDLLGSSLMFDTQPSEGEKAFILGHAAWGVSHRLKASLTSGVISRVVHCDNSPVLIQTSCCVNAGASGGPLLSNSGRLLGIAVCNARDTVNEAWYPHVNLCVPAAVLEPAVVEYMRTGSVARLRHNFATDDAVVQKLWNLQPVNTSPTTSSLTSKL